MKQLLSLLLAAVLGVTAANACMKKPAVSDLTVIVMDTTQALLPNALVKCGNKVYRTSYDGRVVIPQEQRTAGSLSVSCEGYKKWKSGSGQGAEAVLMVRLTPQLRDEEKAVKAAPFVKTRILRTAAEGATDEVAVAACHSMVRPPVYDRNTNVAAGQLTAGEVNDFAKWRLWDAYLQSSARYQQTWQMAPGERYTVQVTDRHGYPIANYPVSLTDTRGNTLFQTMTDNTGKAELWNGLTGKGERVAVKEPQKTIVVDEECANYRSPETTDLSDVDVVFVFDATGSMGDELNYLQAEMKDVIRRAKDATGGLAIRTGAVVYRDHGDEYITRLSRLTEDLSVTQAFIDKQEANGGGDYPEAVPEALMAAMNSAGWDEHARARIAFLILDAPCHDDSAALAMLHEQVLNAAALGVRIVPVVCSGLDESGEYLMRAIALATNGTSFFLTDDSGIGNRHLHPKTDTLQVEHLNDMLVRTIVEFSYMPDCLRGKWHREEIEHVQEQFVPNPFDATDLADHPAIPHGSTTLYLLDITGKLITIYHGELEDAGDSQLSSLGLPLSTGIYFVKAFYDGQWYTKKILVH